MYRELHWTPRDLEEAPLQEVRDMIQILELRRQMEEANKH